MERPGIHLANVRRPSGRLPNGGGSWVRIHSIPAHNFFTIIWNPTSLVAMRSVYVHYVGVKLAQ